MAAHFSNQALFEHIQLMLQSTDAPDDIRALNDVLDSVRRFPAAIFTKPHFELLLGACDLSASCKAAVTTKLPKRGKKRTRTPSNTPAVATPAGAQPAALPSLPARSSAASPSHGHATTHAPSTAAARSPGTRSGGTHTPHHASKRVPPAAAGAGKPPVWGIFADTAAGVKRSGAHAGEGIFVAAPDWEVVLLLDTREVKSRQDRDYLGSHLRSKGVTVETRQLPLGDMLWVARPKHVPGVRLRTAVASSQKAAPEDAPGDEGGSEAALAVSKAMWPHEWLLSVIVERKRVSDLSASILDGRYEEQKRRLLACPCQRVVYVIEGDLARRDVLTAKGLTSSIASTTVHSGFLVQRTSSVDASIDFLASMHDALRSSFLPEAGSKPLLQCACLPSQPLTYSSFVAQCAKPVATTALQLFGMQLRQIKGMSAPRAEAVLERFSTPYALHCELKQLAGMESGVAAGTQRGSQTGTGTVPVTSVAANKLFAKTHVPGQKAVFGAKLSERLAAFYGQGRYDDAILG